MARPRAGSHLTASALLAVLLCAGCGNTEGPGKSTRSPVATVVADRSGSVVRLVADPASDRPQKVSSATKFREVMWAPHRFDVDSVKANSDGTVVVALSELLEGQPIGTATRGLCIGAEGPSGQGFANVQLREPGVVSDLPNVTFSVIPPEFRRPVSEEYLDVEIWAREAVRFPYTIVSEPIAVPGSATLHFAVGFEQAGTGGEVVRARFRLTADNGRGPSTLYEEMLQLDELTQDTGTSWTEATVDLSEFADTQTSFTFRTEIVDGAGNALEGYHFVSPLWTTPILLTSTATPAQPRNVILLSLDTLRADRLGVYGYHRDLTPNLDAFARESYLFEQCFAPSSWTTPSHATIFTGLHPAIHQAGMGTTMRVRDELTTLAEIAKQHGYVTAAFTDGAAVAAQLGFHQGFDCYSNGHTDQWPLPPGSAEKMFRSGLEWLDRYGDQPYFLFLHTYEVHAPYEAPPPFRGRFAKGPVELYTPAFVRYTDEQIQQFSDLYDECVAYTDYAFGQFMDALRAGGYLEDTLVIVFSDHGEEFGEHGGTIHGITLYDEQLHVPYIVHVPGTNGGGVRIPDQVALSDTFSTVLDYAQWDHTFPLDSISLLPLMNLPSRIPAYNRTMVTSSLQQESLNLLMVSARVPDWKYIASSSFEHKESPVYGQDHAQTIYPDARKEVALLKFLVDGGRDWWAVPEDERPPMYAASREELYLLTEDPGEQRDYAYPVAISDDKIAILENARKRLLERLRNLVQESEALQLTQDEAVALSFQEMEALRALGYVQE